jgi:hypothetical protein
MFRARPMASHATPAWFKLKYWWFSLIGGKEDSHISRSPCTDSNRAGECEKCVRPHSSPSSWAAVLIKFRRRGEGKGRAYEARAAQRAQAYLNSTSSTVVSKRNEADAALSGAKQKDGEKSVFCLAAQFLNVPLGTRPQAKLRRPGVRGLVITYLPFCRQPHAFVGAALSCGYALEGFTGRGPQQTLR